MDMEDIEHVIEKNKYIMEALGFMDYNHYEEFKFHTCAGLARFGDNFTKALGLTLIEASTKDALKIIRYRHQECEQANILNRMYVAKRKAEKENEA